MRTYLVFFQGRRTGVAATANTRSTAIEKARKLKRRGGNRVVRARKMTQAELKTAKSGRWVRTGPNGEKPGYNRNKRGFGPKPKSKVVKFS